MNNHIRISHLLVATLILILVITACGSNINLPLANIKTGPTQTADGNRKATFLHIQAAA
jgi:hypothetical protein